jgi:hypothetical protein
LISPAAAVSFSTLVLMQFFQHLVSKRRLILSSLTLLLLIFSVLTALAIAPLSAGDDVLLDDLRRGASTQVVVLIVSGVLCGICQALLTGSAMAYASIFSRPSYLQAVSGGMGVAGLSISAANLLVSLPGIAHDCAAAANASLPVAGGQSTTPEHAREVIGATCIYFGASVVVLFLCLLSFCFVEWLPFTRARKRLNERAAEVRTSTSIVAAEGAAGSVEPITCTMDGSGSSETGERPGLRSQTSAHLASQIDRASLMRRARRGSIMRAAPRGGSGGSSCGELIRQLWKWATSIGMIYVVTISIFPSLTSTIIAAPANWTGADGGIELGGGCQWERIFVPLGFVIFNLGDTIGRNMPCLMRSPNKILTAVLCRLVFAPLFMLCHTASGGGIQLPLFWGSDAMPLIIMLFFSVSNGWLTSSVFVASQGVIEPQIRDFAASMLMMCLNGGIFFGAAFSFVVRYVDCTPTAANAYCNPFISPNVSAT